MVYDVTKCGLNKLVWAPNLFIPSVSVMVDLLDNSWFVDGSHCFWEMFLNFPLDPVGMVIQEVFNGDQTFPVKYLPFFLMGGGNHLGNPRDTTSPVQYDSVKLNMLGEHFYRPDKP
jgi:hypothetical protein